MVYNFVCANNVLVVDGDRQFVVRGNEPCGKVIARDTNWPRGIRTSWADPSPVFLSRWRCLARHPRSRLPRNPDPLSDQCRHLRRHRVWSFPRCQHWYWAVLGTVDVSDFVHLPARCIVLCRPTSPP